MNLACRSVDSLRHRLSHLLLFARIAIDNAAIIITGAICGMLITRYLAQQAADRWLVLLFAVFTS